MKYKKLTVALALIGVGALSGQAFANSAPEYKAEIQVHSGGQEEFNSGAKMGLLVDPTSANSLVNPFNGKPVSAETLQRELELSQVRSKLLEEQLRQTNTIAELKHLPFKRGLETEQTKTQILKEELSQKIVDEEMNPPPPPPPPGSPQAFAKQAAEEIPGASYAEVEAAKEEARERARLAAQKQAKAEAVAAAKAKKAAAELAAKTPPAKLVSIVRVGDSLSAVLDVNGSVATLKHGSKSSLGLVTILDDSTAIVNGWTLKVHEQTMGRYVESDKVLASNGFSGGGNASSAVPAALPKGVLPPDMNLVSGGLPPPIPEGSPFGS